MYQPQASIKERVGGFTVQSAHQFSDGGVGDEEVDEAHEADKKESEDRGRPHSAAESW